VALIRQNINSLFTNQEIIEMENIELNAKNWQIVNAKLKFSLHFATKQNQIEKASTFYFSI
jgi:hypothetical protein